MLLSFADLQARSNARAAEATHGTTKIDMDDTEHRPENEENNASDDDNLGDSAGTTPRRDLTAGGTAQLTQHYPLSEGIVADLGAFQQVPSLATSSVLAESTLF